MNSATPPAVIVQPVERKTVPIYKEFVGRTDANQTIDIRARVEGVLDKASFKEGEFVSQGQILFTIDDQSYKASLESAVADQEKAESLVLHAQQQVELKQAQADLKKFESALVLAQQDLARAKPLVEQGAIERRQLDLAVDAEHQAKANVDSQRAKVDNTALNQRVELKQAQAQLESARAAVKQAQLNLGYTIIKSPIKGIIGLIKVYPGNLVGRGENTLLATVSAVDPIKVNFSISESAYLDAIKHVDPNGPDFPVKLLLADGSQHPYPGKLTALGRAVDPKTGTINIQGIFANPKAVLRPGQFCRVQVMVEKRKDALLVPVRCIQEVQGLKTVMVVDAANKVSLKTVTLGPQVGNDIIVTQGLTAGQQVIVEGLQKARPGDTVTIEPNKT